MSDLDPLIAELEAAAARLSSGQLDTDEAAALVEHVAELAGRLGGELDRQARAASAEPAAGQESLL